MLNRSLKAGTQVRCSLKGSGHRATASGGFTDGKVYTLRQDFKATGRVHQTVLVTEDDNGSTHNGWNASCFVEVDAVPAPTPAWDADSVKQLLRALLKDAVEAHELASARAILNKLLLF